MLRCRGAITVARSGASAGVALGDTLERVVVVSSLMSLTVFDVTVRSVAIIVLSAIAAWFASRGRTRAQFKPAMVRVDKRPVHIYKNPNKDKSLRSAGFLGVTSLAAGICLAFFVSLLAAYLYSTLTGSLGS